MLNLIVATLVVIVLRDSTQNVNMHREPLIGFLNKTTLPFRKGAQLESNKITTLFSHLLVIFLYPA